ncbi:methylenetetrahydrofolate reductase C-terminal domain-containing protein [Dethiosulfatarculus sandiegensis]|uniref:Zinc-finger protein n=1 Tax=Dethiosulfatarculus sandiegensis TaxID=1429043 RepID=A0A0D2K2L8_9BACT|nr:methylenetetrahydrofolate reductase C-terminal domain-containing protein [Dethiosulfatarculus sandiegensis]KIX15880.1 zinc-finger protein [Dethiosulfatarculus sandiegensis]
MITAVRKPIEEIMDYVAPFNKILLIGCNECVTVCYAGGRKEVGILASALSMAFLKQGKKLEIDELTLERQCDPEYVEEIAKNIDKYDAVCSMACGCGVQTISGRYKDMPVFPMVNTTFMGASESQGIWAERCQGCGDCVLGYTGGICPVSRCSKKLFNGPCGGSDHGKCEISEDVDCAWQLIWDRLVALGRTDLYKKLMEPKDWRPAGGGGPRKIVREDLFS